MRFARTRRDFFRQCALGLGNVAVSQLMAADDPLAVRAPHFAAKAKHIIFLFMEGGPSQLDLLDPKPELQKWNGQPLPESLRRNLRFAFIKPDAAVMASPRTFVRHGSCGTEFSDLLPHTASCADDICVVRGMHTDAVNHHPGQLLLFTGTTQFGRPTIGAWVLYGLGSESQNLPGFIVLSSGRGTSGGANNWSSGFLPSPYQGVAMRNTGDPVVYLSDPPGVDRAVQRETLDALGALNREHAARTHDAEIDARIASYELAFRMQMSAPELLDYSKEPAETLAMYGVDREPTRPFAVNCLLARRMVERGVRVVMLMHASWDDHSNLNQNLKKNCEITDQPAAALLKDLKRRGLLDSTLVIWGGEFGRTPMVQIRNTKPDSAGRDHHPAAYSMWLAGGGIRGGQAVGRSDDLGMNVAEDGIHVHDLQATLLERLGLDHTRLTYRYMGRDFRLTDVSGTVVKRLLA